MNVVDPKIEWCIRETLSYLPLTPKNQDLFREYILLPKRDDSLLAQTEPQNNFHSCGQFFYHPLFRLWTIRNDRSVMDRLLEFLWTVGGTDTVSALMKADGLLSSSDSAQWRADVLGSVPAAFLCAATAFESVHLSNRFVIWMSETAQREPQALLEAQTMCIKHPHAFALLSGVLLYFAWDESIKPFQREELVKNTVTAVPRILFGLPNAEIRQMQAYIEAGDCSAPVPVLPSLQNPAVDISSAQYATWQGHLLMRTYGMAALLAAKQDSRMRCALRFLMLLDPRRLFYDAMQYLPKECMMDIVALLQEVLPGGGVTMLLFAVRYSEHFKLCKEAMQDAFETCLKDAMRYAAPKEYLLLVQHEKDGLPPDEIRQKLAMGLSKCAYKSDEQDAYGYLMDTGSFADTVARLRNVRPGFTSHLSRCCDLLREYIWENGMDDFSVRCAAFMGMVFQRSWLDSLAWMEGGKTDTELLCKLTRRFIENGLPAGTVLEIWDRCYESTYFDERKTAIRKAAITVAESGQVQAIADSMQTGSVFLRSVVLEILGDMASEPAAKEAILTATADSSKQIREQMGRILPKHPEWAEDYKALLKSKKAAVPQLAAEALGRLGERAALEAALETEKNAKVADAIRGVLGAENTTSIGSADDLAANLLKGNKRKKLQWLLEKPLTALRKADGSDAGEDVRDAILISYCDLGRIGRSDTAAELSAGLDSGDLQKLAVEVYDLWFSAGAQAKQKWVLPFAAVYGGAAMTQRLTKAIHDWPEHQRGAIACDAVMALALSDDPAALVFVDGISRKFKFRQIKQAAAAALENAAQELGITTEELADRIVPDLGFGKDGKRVFDYGKRSFTVSLTPTLELSIVNDQGKAVKSMPAPGKTDDPIAMDAYEAFKTMKKQIKTTVSAQRSRLELALSVLRCWDVVRWKALFVENPIMHQFAMSLIWGIYEDGKLTDTFRYMEDGSFNTVDEEEYLLPGDAKIGLVHPVELDEETLGCWKQQLEDYEIEQSIEQLSRPVYPLAQDKAGEKSLEDFGGKVLNSLSLSGKLLGLGWYRGSVVDGGGFDTFYREDATVGIGVELHFSGGFVGYDEGEDVTVYDAVFYTGTVRRGSYVYDKPEESQLLTLGQVPARYYSEIIHQLTRATASSTKTEENWRSERG